MRKMMKPALLIFSVFLLNVGLFAEENVSDIKAFLEELRKDQQELKLELQEIKSLLSRLSQPKAQNAPQQVNIKDVEFEIGDNPVLGSGKAKLIMVEFTDYQCPFCSRYVSETFSQILRNI